MGTRIQVQQYKPELKIHELKLETYNGLVRLALPSYQTIVLLIDKESKPVLFPKFFNSIWPYRKYKRLSFATLDIEKGLKWYGRILRQSLHKSDDLNINPKNSVGTVLVINGFRKYFNLYHAKLDNPPTTPTVDHYENIIFMDELLDGLPNWLKKVFQGIPLCFYPNFWPDFIVK